MAHSSLYINKYDGVPSELPSGGSYNGTLFNIIELQTLAFLVALGQETFRPQPKVALLELLLVVVLIHKKRCAKVGSSIDTF